MEESREKSRMRTRFRGRSLALTLYFWIGVLVGRDFHRRCPSWVHKLCDEIRKMNFFDNYFLLDGCPGDALLYKGTNQRCGRFVGGDLQCQLDLRWIRPFNQCNDQRYVDVVHGLRPQAGKLGNRSDEFDQFLLLFLSDSEVRRPKHNDRRSEIIERLCNRVGDRSKRRREIKWIDDPLLERIGWYLIVGRTSTEIGLPAERLINARPMIKGILIDKWIEGGKNSVPRWRKFK